MPARAFRCTNPNCSRTLGTISRKLDYRGKPYDRLKLNPGVHIGRSLFRGQHAECQCGEKVMLPETVKTVEFP